MKKLYLVVREPKLRLRAHLIVLLRVVEADSSAAALRAFKEVHGLHRDFKAPVAFEVKPGLVVRT